MKNVLLMIFIIILCCSCEKKEEDINQNISSKGELVCAYKVRQSSDNTLYTSYYHYMFSDNGILNGASNVESIEFEKSDKDIKEKYKKQIENIIKEYEDVDGIEVKTTFDDDKYSFEVKMYNSEMNEKTKEDYLLNMDRISIYKTFSSIGYTCE